MKNEPEQKIPVINAELSFDEQHGPIVTVTVDDRRISVYLTHETGTVTRSDGAQYGIEVKGPWHKFRQLVETQMLGGGAFWGEYGPAVSTLPDCMMPDGDSPCVGYTDLRKKAELMAAALHRIGEITLVPGTWTVADLLSLNCMVAAVQKMHEAERKIVTEAQERTAEELSDVYEKTCARLRDEIQYWKSQVNSKPEQEKGE